MNPPPDAASFESALGELQRVVTQLESGSTDVEAALALFERGKALARDCERILEQAQLRLTRLAAESASRLVPDAESASFVPDAESAPPRADDSSVSTVSDATS